MAEFRLIELRQVRGRNTFFKLSKNGVCEFDKFCDEMNRPGRYPAELRTIFTFMDLIANQVPVPEAKFKDITPRKETVKEHEFKTRHLRVYAFQEKGTGKIIVCGGVKGDQKADIRHFRQLKKQYLTRTGGG